MNTAQRKRLHVGDRIVNTEQPQTIYEIAGYPNVDDINYFWIRQINQPDTTTEIAMLSNSIWQKATP